MCLFPIQNAFFPKHMLHLNSWCPQFHLFHIISNTTSSSHPPPKKTAQQNSCRLTSHWLSKAKEVGLTADPSWKLGNLSERSTTGPADPLVEVLAGYMHVKFHEKPVSRLGEGDFFCWKLDMLCYIVPWWWRILAMGLWSNCVSKGSLGRSWQ